MNTVLTRRPLFPRIKARARAAYIRWLIGWHERDSRALMFELERIPNELDGVLDHIAALRVQLALAEREA